MFNNMTPVVKQLLIINIICYIMSLAVVPKAYDIFFFRCIILKILIFEFGKPITHMFMHSKASLMYIFLICLH